MQTNCLHMCADFKKGTYHKIKKGLLIVALNANVGTVFDQFNFYFFEVQSSFEICLLCSSFIVCSPPFDILWNGIG